MTQNASASYAAVMASPRKIKELYNPDIGAPHPKGGACRVAQRINDRVALKPKRDRMLSQLRSGAGLSSGDEKDIYADIPSRDSIGDRGGDGVIELKSLKRGAAAFHHTLARMDLRGISPETVADGIDSYVSAYTTARTDFDKELLSAASRRKLSLYEYKRFFDSARMLDPKGEKIEDKPLKKAWKKLIDLAPDTGKRVAWTDSRTGIEYVFDMEHDPRLGSMVKLVTVYPKGGEDPRIPREGCDPSPSGSAFGSSARRVAIGVATGAVAGALAMALYRSRRAV